MKKASLKEMYLNEQDEEELSEVSEVWVVQDTSNPYSPFLVSIHNSHEGAVKMVEQEAKKGMNESNYSISKKTLYE